MEGETLKLLARAAQPIDMATADAGAAGLRVHVENEEAILSVAALLARMQSEAKIKTSGPVSFCVADRTTGAEIDIATGGEYPVNPQIKGAIKAMPGVALVEEV
jgi:DNA polymerase-3 subunit alpha